MLSIKNALMFSSCSISSIGRLLGATVFILLFSTFLSQAAPRVIEIRTEKVGEVMHWMPEKVEVSAGEQVKFVVKHELEGGFDFHGFNIRELNIVKQVDRNKPMEILAQIPDALAEGTYKIGCQFHPKHMASGLLVVKAAAAPSHSDGAPIEDKQKKKK